MLGITRHTFILFAASSALLLTTGCKNEEEKQLGTFLAGYMPSDPCTLHTSSSACGAVSECAWNTLEVECPAGTDCPEGFCAHDDACQTHADQSSCTGDAANGCAWAHRNQLCLGNQDCEDADGFCYAHDVGDGECACLCPLYCPKGEDCPDCECDCNVIQDQEPALGGTCTCDCEPCGPGESCAPCDCACADSTAVGEGGCVNDATCLCLCLGDACECSCYGDDPAAGTAETCVCPACPDGMSCEACACDGDPCGTHADQVECNADAAGCNWVALDIDCGGNNNCNQGVCRSETASLDDCTCACIGSVCACDCSQLDSCTPV